MNIYAEPLLSRKQTGEKMRELINRYSADLDCFCVIGNRKCIPLTELSLETFFNLVRKMPYKKDLAPIEKIARPAFLIRTAQAGLDCKKKSILLGAYFAENRIPYRFIASSTRPDKRVHHVFPQILHNGDWKNADATYPQYRLFAPKNTTYMEVLA